MRPARAACGWRYGCSQPRRGLAQGLQLCGKQQLTEGCLSCNRHPCCCISWLPAGSNRHNHLQASACCTTACEAIPCDQPCPVLNSMRCCLRVYGCCTLQVTPCSSTAEALALLNSGSSFDVLLADKDMLAGKACSSAGQQLLDMCQGVPCILMAANPAQEDIMTGAACADAAVSGCWDGRNAAAAARRKGQRKLFAIACMLSLTLLPSTWPADAGLLACCLVMLLVKPAVNACLTGFCCCLLLSCRHPAGRR